ncbi:MAG: putative zinc-binding metallopeptidase [Ideonella sp.]
MSPFTCSHCSHTVFFENSECGFCNSLLGFVPAQRSMVAFELPTPASGETVNPLPLDAWLRRGTDGAWLRPCANRINHGVCNWMLDVGDDAALCISCRLTEVIPSLEDPNNLRRWAAIERAKRRLVFGLMEIGLTPQPKTGPDDKLGLAFNLLENLPGAASVMTGHDDGLITLNIAEADDVFRESARVSMHEPLRTLLGHLRHEVSHYLQQRYVAGTPGELRCRALFGDHDADYAAALQTHYANGAPADWSTHFVSAYASSHPWEDWAESCAHYLLVIDAVQTASSWGLRLDGPTKAVTADDLDPRVMPLKNLVLEQWLPVAQFLNSMNRSLGLPDSYPFLMPPQVLEKMQLVQNLLALAAASANHPVGPQCGVAGGVDGIQSGALPTPDTLAQAASLPPIS